MIFKMHNCIDNCPEVVAHLHWKLWPWKPPQFHLPSPGSACCATLHCQVVHLNNIQRNFALEQYPVHYCIWTIFSAILHIWAIFSVILLLLDYNALHQNSQAQFNYALQSADPRFENTAEYKIHICRGRPSLLLLRPVWWPLFYTKYPTDNNCTPFCFPFFNLVPL